MRAIHLLLTMYLCLSSAKYIPHQGESRERLELDNTVHHRKIRQALPTSEDEFKRRMKEKERLREIQEEIDDKKREEAELLQDQHEAEAERYLESLQLLADEREAEEERLLDEKEYLHKLEIERDRLLHKIEMSKKKIEDLSYKHSEVTTAPLVNINVLDNSPADPEKDTADPNTLISVDVGNSGSDTTGTLVNVDVLNNAPADEPSETPVPVPLIDLSLVNSGSETDASLLNVDVLNSGTNENTPTNPLINISALDDGGTTGTLLNVDVANNPNADVPNGDMEPDPLIDVSALNSGPETGGQLINLDLLNNVTP